MLFSKTVFVLGAAISNEFRMPLGGTLKTLIRAALPDSGSSEDALHAAIYDGVPADQASEAVKRIFEGLLATASIDNLVEHLKADHEAVRIAKLAIADVILKQESVSALAIRDGRTGIEDTAYDGTLGAIFRLIVGNVSKADLGEAFSRVAFVTFNYDRCLEEFLLRALAAHSGLNLVSAAKIVRRVEIVHAYGAVAPLEHIEDGGVRYGCPGNQVDLCAAANRLKTFSEELYSKEKSRIDSLMGDAQRIIILGCHPHPQNLELLRPPTNSARRFFMTAYLPAPPDPLGNAHPEMQDFARPMIDQLRGVFLNDWKRSAGAISLDGLDVSVEPLTSLQMVARYGNAWITKVAQGAGTAAGVSSATGFSA